MQQQGQPTVQSNRKRYVAPTLEKYGMVHTLTQTTPNIANILFDGGSGVNMYTSTPFTPP